MEVLRQQLRELERMAKTLPNELWNLRTAICRRLRQNKLEFMCSENEGALVFTVFYESTREKLKNTTFGVTLEGTYRAVGEEWEIPEGHTGSILFMFHDSFEFSSLRRVDPFDDNSNIFIGLSAHIEMLLQTPELAAEFCLKMAETVAAESFEADQAIFQLLNPIHIYKGDS